MEIIKWAVVGAHLQPNLDPNRYFMSSNVSQRLTNV